MQDIPCHRAVHPPIWSRGLDSVQTTSEKAVCFHDATFALDHEDNLDGQSDKWGHTRTDRLPSMEDLLIRKNLRCNGHLMRMSPDTLPKQVLYSQLSSGHRKRRRAHIRFTDTIKRNLKLRVVKINSWTSLSQQRDKWRATVKWWKQCLSLRDRQHDDDDGVFYYAHGL